MNNKIGKIIGSVIILFGIAGCAITSSQVAKEYNEQQKILYTQYAKAKADVVREVMNALAKIDRGGMKVEIGADGKVKAIQYIERFDTNILKDALVMSTPKQYIPKSGIQEFGDFFLKFSSFTTPVASMWLNYKSHKVDAWSNVEISKANAQRDSNMYNAFTSNFQNKEVVTITNTEIQKSVEKETQINNSKEVHITNAKEIQNVTNNKETNNIKDTSSDIVKETTTNNNNNGGNQNIGETNKIIPLIQDVESNTESGGNDGFGDDVDEGCLPGAPCE